MLAVPTALVVASPPARAQASADRARPGDARAHLESRRFAAVCPILEALARRFPDSASSKENLAKCYAAQSRLGSAWAMWPTLRPASLLAALSPPPAIGDGVPTWARILGAAGLGRIAGSISLRASQSATGTAFEGAHPPPDRPGGKSGYEFAADRGRDLRDYGLIVGLGIGGVATVGASVVGVVTGTPAKPFARGLTGWTVLPTGLPGRGTGAVFTTAW